MAAAIDIPRNQQRDYTKEKKKKNPIPEEKSAHGNNIAFVSALNGEISLLFLAEWWQVVRARRRSVMPQIPESCYERDERRIVLLLPAV